MNGAGAEFTATCNDVARPTSVTADPAMLRRWTWTTARWCGRLPAGASVDSRALAGRDGEPRALVGNWALDWAGRGLMGGGTWHGRKLAWLSGSEHSTGSCATRLPARRQKMGGALSVPAT